MTHSMFGGGFEAWAIIALVVEIGPAANHRSLEFRQQRLYSAVEFSLAEIAARPVIADIIGIVEFFGSDNEVADTDLPRQVLCVRDFSARHTGAVRGHGHCAIAQS